MSAQYVTEHKLGVTYIHLLYGETVTQTITHGDMVNVDINADGKVVGVELLTSMEPAMGCQIRSDS